MDEDTPYADETSILPSLGQQDKCDVLENISHLYSCRNPYFLKNETTLCLTLKNMWITNFT